MYAVYKVVDGVLVCLEQYNVLRKAAMALVTVSRNTERQNLLLQSAEATPFRYETIVAVGDPSGDITWCVASAEQAFVLANADVDEEKQSRQRR